ncbi:Arc family DNA-binding protein [Stutzerimonas nitrititolerans]|uniref:Arc family DNA-binding protein n=1 Tax=Stutzerimonas nitrititolerans TaxID=2482751 RepID=UPI0035E3F29D
MTDYSSRTADKFVVRLPDGMRGRIFDVAGSNHRSMNSEIIHRLQQSFAAELGSQSPQEQLDELLRRAAQLSNQILTDRNAEQHEEPSHG